MKQTVRIVALASAVGLTGVASAGDITGKITLKGTPPAAADLPFDANCGKLVTGPKPKTKFYVVGADSGLADVVVSLKGITGKSAGASAPAAVLDQVACEYTPYVLAVQTSQKITVKNSDPILHNVHPTPTAAGNKEENKAQLPKGPDLNFVFPSAESFLRFKCDVHPWMFAYVSVFDHPYFAVSGKDGSFKISGVPAGKYTLEANHRKGGVVTQEIEVKDGAVTANFTIEAK